MRELRLPEVVVAGWNGQQYQNVLFLQRLVVPPRIPQSAARPRRTAAADRSNGAGCYGLGRDVLELRVRAPRSTPSGHAPRLACPDLPGHRVPARLRDPSVDD